MMKSLSFIDDTQEFSYAYQGDIELYRVDYLEVDQEGYVSYSIGYYRSRAWKRGWRSTAGGKRADLKHDRYISHTRLNKKAFLDRFLLIETVSTAILTLRFAQSVQTYVELHAIFDRLSLYDRMKICKSLWQDDFPNQYGDLLNLRNQAFHSFEEERFRYGANKCWIDAEFNERLKRDFNAVIKYLLTVLRQLEPQVAGIQTELRRDAHRWADKE